MTGLLLLVLAAGIPASVGAQELGSIAGAVKDASGAVLPGVTVEAASPALIEKVRTAVTDGSGQYRIINLPPGTYSVTFTLTGFSNVRREGLDVAIGVTSQVNADMKVGAVAETITVTGEAPVVDVQTAAQTRTVTAQAFKELPSGGSWIQMAALVPAVRASNTDVGGVLGDQTGAQVSGHGSLPGDGVSMIDGMRIGNMYIASNLTNMSLSPLLFDEVNVQLSGQIAETGTNGVIMNAIPRSGGNRFSGSLLANGSGPALQSSNITPNLNSRGVQGASSTLKTLYDLNGAIGGPIKKDKVWFYATSRYFTNEFFLASKFYAQDPNALVRTSDTGRQAYAGTYTYDNNGRVTWAISPKQKISGWYAYQYKVDPHWLLNVFNYSPEAARITTWHTQLSTTKWSYAATNKLLLEVGVMAGASPDTILLDPNQVGTCPSQGGLAPRCIGIIEQVGFQGATAGMTYRAPTGFDFNDKLPSQSVIGSMTYVTGSHSAKVGFEMQRGYVWRGDNNDSTGGLWYTTTAGVPTFVTIQSPVTGYQNDLNYNMGLYAQDRWTLNRLTLAGGVRLDMQNESTEPFTAAPHRWLPNRNVPFAAVENVPNWKDINPRVSVAYDLFGNGKTAVKASASRGVQQDSVGIAASNNPATTLVTQTQRTWTDANHNFVPDCDLTIGTLNGECGPWQTPNFGSANPATVYSPSIMNGWGVRPWNWEFSAGVQQELASRISLSVGYFRRVYGNFFITDNQALGPNDFTQYSVTVPSTIGNGFTLPSAGQVVGGLFDQNKIVAPQNVVLNASTYGAQYQHWTGFDVSVDARLRSSLYLQGGVSTGRTMTDNCAVAAQAPEIMTALGVTTPIAYCHQETPWQPLYKGLAAYTLPYGVRVSGTLQSLPGPAIAGNVIYNNASRVASTTLSRPFTLAQANVATVSPNSVFGDRLNQIDLRFTKIVKVGSGNFDIDVDLYNAFNSDAVLTELGGFGPVWRLPTSIIQPRFLKFQVRYDF
ncbi:MAG TPA: carboxypeptidase regulatory-like domain-containing protein [Vicinamibacterales bacterium]|nr:carboxypeptidase regulatory-like domain-containing protein [Vicinamibacterales bacterium]